MANYMYYIISYDTGQDKLNGKQYGELQHLQF